MPEVITNKLDLWTSALLTKSTAGRGSNGKLVAYGIKKLRALILELAVRGKLVPQDPNDEPANSLLENIAKEKARLIKDGEIKKEKALPEIGDDEKPFELPQGWEWVRLEDVLLRISNGFSGKQNKNADGYPLSRIETISNSIIDLDKVGYSPDIPKDKLDYFRLRSGDILLSHINSDFHVGKTAVVPNGIELYHGVNLLLLRLSSAVSPKYIDTVINSLRLAGYFVKIAQHAIGQSSINQSKVVQVCIALPPLAEQHRIVAKVDELMVLCDQLEQQQAHSIESHQTLVSSLLGALTTVELQHEFSAAWARIASHFDTLFTTEDSIVQLKQTILQLAVMGRLVPQDPNDESASELLKRIAAEKARRVMAGKVKKDKPLPPITEEEKSFKLPSGWEWVKLGMLMEMFNGRAFNQTEWSSSGLPIIRIQNLNDKNAPFNYFSGDVSENNYVEPGAFLISWSGTPGTSFGAFIWNGTSGALNQHINKCMIFGDEINKQYLRLAVNSCMDHLIENAQGGVGLKHVTKGTLNNCVFAIPPLSEQHRIVAKVDELMSLCDTLKARLADANAIQLHLADAIVEQAVA